MVKRDGRLGSVYRDVVLHTGVNFDDSTHLKRLPAGRNIYAKDNA